ncbi:MAG TPA: DUF951 domain-containing protein [Firmicutes bacterium]|jgi:hypothetical protein|nr:DUF951 domain-containing protein [Bacillota bacterium]HAW70112.1 DUF951 domain-containing protein [Bacillota bacterium]HAZ21005.1 DUF951 domain-containing protein [Bacillota bacterium]HBE06950.1 DUF951 domain-containing protein [Bacillota bacterium]HBG44540.1 DUF951 domain-containing protein [Bacillota bacterium]
MPMKLQVGDVVRMRKEHPCGGTDWEIMRVGMDFRIKCLQCGRVVMLPRVKFEKGIKTVLQQAHTKS